MDEQQEELFKSWAEDNAVPGAGAEEIRGKIIELFKNKALSAPARNTKISEAVVEELEKRGKFFYHADLRDFSATMYFDTRRKVLRHVQADMFQSWLSQWISINRADKLFTYIMKEVENAALNGANTTGIIPEHYWAVRDETIYMSNGDGRVVKISANRVESVDNGTDGVLFPCGKTLKPWELTTPVDPFEACALFKNISCSAAHGKSLLAAWVISLPTNPKCKPPLSLTGCVGSGKTRVAKGIAELFGILPWIVKADENGEGNFWPAINEGGIFTMDNADTHIKWLADALAAAATQGSSVRRRLYTDADNIHLQSKSWIIITSANPSFAADAGLADRLLVVRMGRREGETSDAGLSDEIIANRDGGLSFIATTLAKALAESGKTPKNLNSRHPDFASLAVRIGKALGREDDFTNALRSAEADKSRICVENDWVGGALLTWLQDTTEVVGTAGDLTNSLQSQDGVTFARLTARKLAKTLANLWPHLEAVFNAHKEMKHGGVLEYSFSRRE